MPRRRNRKTYRFPWRGGNRFELLSDGNTYLPRMLAAIGAAREFVLLEMYLIKSGDVTTRFIDALLAAAARGARVRLLLDDYGARGLKHSDRQRLQESTVRLAWYNPLQYRKRARNLYRDHRKLLLADAEVAFIGGAGLTDEFDPGLQRGMYWHDVMLQIEGPVLQDWAALFLETWHTCADDDRAFESVLPAARGDGQQGRIALAAGPHAHEINRSVVKRIRTAEHRIWIVTPYFLTTWKIRRALRRAARNGIDTRLLLPGPYSDHPWVSHAARGVYRRLLRNGVRIFEYQPRFIHAKVVLCDQWVSLGSSNLDRWDQHWNLDANQEVDDQRFAHSVERLFSADFALSDEIDYASWRRRPWQQRVRERLAGLLVLWLQRLSRWWG
ncbi:MAG: phosphatidylserine/phosphatidylglycerophosphate/cardiolipin synthase family protein [Pseudomonadota bacterium]|nr:MAG: phosphatidylserine/phosphatidylglycerophosphate/cardiolipin synthase family protein [Pseudomonadota bacterium]